MNPVTIPELLSPAGNFEKLESAFRFGADAVYLAGERFGMRAAADNFSLSELKAAKSLAESLGKKIYLTLNVMPREHELIALTSYLEMLSDSAPDALIVADQGVFSLCQKHLPNVPIHISTQAATVNSEGCLRWYEAGACRVVLARELSLSEIVAIRSKIPADLELEAFIHGSMCVSFSGRCMLSEYYTGRDANRGECTQPCRWQYHFHEEKRPEDVLTCEIYPEGSYIFGSKDLCMIEHMKELIEAGISSLKIEGRMKSAYYTAVVTNAYRIALNQAFDRVSFDDLKRELNSVSHREYCTGYYFDPAMASANLAQDSGYIGDKSYLAQVISYDENTSCAKCIQKNKFLRSDRCEYLTPGSCGKELTVLNMMDEFGNSIESCPHPQQIFYLKTAEKLKCGDLIRKYL